VLDFAVRARDARSSHARHDVHAPRRHRADDARKSGSDRRTHLIITRRARKVASAPLTCR
jgi:hypothetical protein